MKKIISILSPARYLILIAAVLFGSLPLPVSAMDIPFFQGNDIFYYDGPGGACSTVGVSYSTRNDLPSLSGADNAEKIWNFLKSEGLSDEQAAGIMGNLKQESNYDPAAVEGNGVGFGIIQWSFERRTALEKAAEEKGVPASDLGFQLAYMKQEAESTQLVDFNNLYSSFDVSESDNAWDPLKELDTVERATTFWHDAFERSGDYDNHGDIQHRIDFANEAYEQFKGTGGVASAGSSQGGAACSAAGSGDLIATLLEYAHPEFHPNNYSGPVPPPKPAYLEVATKLTEEGKWVGGGMAEIGIPGIDCGGFVSILLTQSGFEPDYNFGLDMDRGSSNQEFGQLPWAMRHWSYLGTGGQINTSDLRPGDVAYSNGHTFLFVGQVDGFESQYASASYSWWRAPMSAGTFETATSPDYVWYGRREGTPPAYGTTSMSDPIPPGNDVHPGESVWTGGES